MKKTFVTILGFLVLTTLNHANAIVRDGWERPIAYAKMDKNEASRGFQTAENVTLTLTQLDGSKAPTGMVLNYYDSATRKSRTVVLEITNKREAECGSVEYSASLPRPRIALENERLTSVTTLPIPYEYARFNVTLRDHSNRRCMDLVANLWEASVREGFGWCGTMDDTMSLAGQAEVIYTIMEN